MGRTASTAQGERAVERAARIVKARQRRLALDTDRAARDARVDAAVADVYLAQDRRARAVALVAQADAAVGEAVTRVLAEGVPIAQVANLCQLTVTAIHRAKAARGAPPNGISNATEPGATDPRAAGPHSAPTAGAGHD